MSQKKKSKYLNGENMFASLDVARVWPTEHFAHMCTSTALQERALQRQLRNLSWECKG